MAIQVSGTEVISDAKTLKSITLMGIPVGADADRPSSPLTGSLFFNTGNSADAYLEFYSGSAWTTLTSNS